MALDKWLHEPNLWDEEVLGYEIVKIEQMPEYGFNDGIFKLGYAVTDQTFDPKLPETVGLWFGFHGIMQVRDTFWVNEVNRLRLGVDMPYWHHNRNNSIMLNQEQHVLEYAVNCLSLRKLQAFGVTDGLA